MKRLSNSTVDLQKIEVTLDDGAKSPGLICRAKFETIEKSSVRQYPDPRPAIVFFHGLSSRKESYESYLIPLAHLGYVAVAFDQRGHGDAGGNPLDWHLLYNDIESVINFVCSLEDVKEGALCCVGKSMGANSVLTKCYEDQRVAMVVGISALHSIESMVNAKFRFFSAGWYVRRLMAGVDDESAIKLTPHYYLKNDPEYNKNRVYLIHGKQDSIFPPSLTFEKNKKQAAIPENQAVLLENCGHSFEGQELIILALLLRWIQNNSTMKF